MTIECKANNGTNGGSKVAFWLCPCLECTRMDWDQRREAGIGYGVRLDEFRNMMFPDRYPKPELLDCGHEPTVTDGIGTGSAVGDDDMTMCYNCAKVEVVDAILNATVESFNNGKQYGNPLPVMYVSSDWQRLTTWDGQNLARIGWVGKRHNFAARYSDDKLERRFFNAVGIFGADTVYMTGVGAPGEYAVCRTMKVVT